MFGVVALIYLSIHLGNLSEFARLIAMAKSTVWPWYSGNGVPSLNVLLQICHRFDLSLFNFLCGEITAVDFSQENVLVKLQLHQSISCNKQRFNLERMQLELRSVLEENPLRCHTYWIL